MDTMKEGHHGRTGHGVWPQTLSGQGIFVQHGIVPGRHRRQVETAYFMAFARRRHFAVFRPAPGHAEHHPEDADPAVAGTGIGRARDAHGVRRGPPSRGIWTDGPGPWYHPDPGILVSVRSGIRGPLRGGRCHGAQWPGGQSVDRCRFFSRFSTRRV